MSFSASRVPRRSPRSRPPPVTVSSSRRRRRTTPRCGPASAARVSPAWSGDDKRTTIRFRSGAELRLDHQRVTGNLVGATSATSFALGDAVPRLVAHYVPMLSEILVEGHRRFSPSDDVTLHRLLLAARSAG